MPHDYLTLPPELLCRLIKEWTHQYDGPDMPEEPATAAETLNILLANPHTANALAQFAARYLQPDDAAPPEPPANIRLLTVPAPDHDSAWFDEPTDAATAVTDDTVKRVFRVRSV